MCLTFIPRNVFRFRPHGGRYQISLFFRLNGIPSYGYPTFDLSIHELIDGHMDCFHFLAIVNSIAANVHVQAVTWISAFISLGYVLSVALLGHMVTLGLPL